jgi:hypothetical protein
LEIKSSLSFNNSDICVALYSTLIYERIFMGFKSIIAPLGIHDFPIPGTALYKSSAKSKDELFEKLDRFRPISNEEYISDIGFEDRYYKNFKELC